MKKRFVPLPKRIVNPLITHQKNENFFGKYTDFNFVEDQVSLSDFGVNFPNYNAKLTGGRLQQPVAQPISGADWAGIDYPENSYSVCLAGENNETLHNTYYMGTQPYIRVFQPPQTETGYPYVVTRHTFQGKKFDFFATIFGEFQGTIRIRKYKRGCYPVYSYDASPFIAHLDEQLDDDAIFETVATFTGETGKNIYTQKFAFDLETDYFPAVSLVYDCEYIDDKKPNGYSLLNVLGLDNQNTFIIPGEIPDGFTQVSPNLNSWKIDPRQNVTETYQSDGFSITDTNKAVNGHRYIPVNAEFSSYSDGMPSTNHETSSLCYSGNNMLVVYNNFIRSLMRNKTNSLLDLEREFFWQYDRSGEYEDPNLDSINFNIYVFCGDFKNIRMWYTCLPENSVGDPQTPVEINFSLYALPDSVNLEADNSAYFLAEQAGFPDTTPLESYTFTPTVSWELSNKIDFNKANYPLGSSETKNKQMRKWVIIVWTEGDSSNSTYELQDHLIASYTSSKIVSLPFDVCAIDGTIIPGGYPTEDSYIFSTEETIGDNKIIKVAKPEGYEENFLSSRIDIAEGNSLTLNWAQVGTNHYAVAKFKKPTIAGKSGCLQAKKFNEIYSNRPGLFSFEHEKKWFLYTDEVVSRCLVTRDQPVYAGTYSFQEIEGDPNGTSNIMAIEEINVPSKVVTVDDANYASPTDTNSCGPNEYIFSFSAEASASYKLILGIGELDFVNYTILFSTEDKYCVTDIISSYRDNSFKNFSETTHIILPLSSDADIIKTASQQIYLITPNATGDFEKWRGYLALVYITSDDTIVANRKYSYRLIHPETFFAVGCVISPYSSVPPVGFTKKYTYRGGTAWYLDSYDSDAYYLITDREVDVPVVTENKTMYFRISGNPGTRFDIPTKIKVTKIVP